MDKKDLFIKEKLQQDKKIPKDIDDMFKNFKGGDIKMENNSKPKFVFPKILAVAACMVFAVFIGLTIAGKNGQIIRIGEKDKASSREEIELKSNLESSSNKVKEVQNTFENKFMKNVETMQMISFYHDTYSNGKEFSDEAILHILPFLDGDTKIFSWDDPEGATANVEDAKALAQLFFGKNIYIPSKYLKGKDLIVIDTPTGFGIVTYDILSTRYIKDEEYKLDIKYKYGVEGEADFKEVVYTFTIDYNDGYIVLKTLEGKTNTNEPAQGTSSNTATTPKIQDASKDIVYDLYNETGKKYSYKVPYININSDDVKAINKKIESKFKEYIETARKNDNNEEYFNDLYKVSYETYINDDILSIVITLNWSANGWNSFDVYNINVSNGNEISNSEILKRKNLSQTEFLTKVKNALEKAFKEKYKLAEDAENYEELLSNTISEKNYSVDIPMFLDNNGKLNIIGNIYAIAGPEAYYHIVNIEI